jgi:Secretion system C-terminal sorting domain
VASPQLFFLIYYKMKIYILIITFFVNSFSYSQNWDLVNTNTNEEIKDIYFKDELIGFAVAGQGKILKTIDSGLIWNLIYENNELFQEQSIVVTSDKVYCFGQNFNGVVKKLEFFIDLNDFQFSTINVLFVPQNPICFNNIIFDSGVKYNNNGEFEYLIGPIEPFGATISNGSSNIYNYSNYLTASDGHYIFISADGNNWNNIQFAQPFLSSDPFQSYYDGISKMRTVTNYPCIIHISDDNGLSWSHTWIQPTTAFFLTFINAEKVLALGLFTEQNKIYYSIDSGLTFDFETVINPVKKIYSFNNNLTFAYGNNGVIYRSINGGGLLNVNDIKKNENNLIIYPNPATNEFNIATEKIINKIQIIDNCGRIVKTINPTINQTTINVSGLTKGVYSVILVCDGVTKKVKSLIIE